MGDYRTLIVYQKAFSLAMKIYHISKKFPAEEKYGLTVQIRNSSRSVCVNLVEAYKRRQKMEKHKSGWTSEKNAFISVRMNSRN
jgi:four helix bundle protein